MQVYLDRGVLSSNGVNTPISVRACCSLHSASRALSRLLSLQEEFKLSDVENGVLPAAFLLGLLVASVVYSELAKTYNAFRLIGEPAAAACSSVELIVSQHAALGNLQCPKLFSVAGLCCTRTWRSCSLSLASVQPLARSTTTSLFCLILVGCRVGYGNLDSLLSGMWTGPRLLELSDSQGHHGRRRSIHRQSDRACCRPSAGLLCSADRICEACADPTWTISRPQSRRRSGLASSSWCARMDCLRTSSNVAWLQDVLPLTAAVAVLRTTDHVLFC